MLICRQPNSEVGIAFNLVLPYLDNLELIAVFVGLGVANIMETLTG